jgi:hypothetical protein
MVLRGKNFIWMKPYSALKSSSNPGGCAGALSNTRRALRGKSKIAQIVLLRNRLNYMVDHQEVT